MRICGQRLRQNTSGGADVAVVIHREIVAAMGKRSAFRILPALRIEILQHGMAIGGRITILTVTYAMTHCPTHVIHHASRHRFNTGIH